MCKTCKIQNTCLTLGFIKSCLYTILRKKLYTYVFICFWKIGKNIMLIIFFCFFYCCSNLIWKSLFHLFGMRYCMIYSILTVSLKIISYFTHRIPFSCNIFVTYLLIIFPSALPRSSGISAFIIRPILIRLFADFSSINFS